MVGAVLTGKKSSIFKREGDPLYFFVHVHKTAGTFFLHRVVYQNFEAREILAEVRVKGFKKRLKSFHRFAYGHVAYGIHWFTYRPVIYLTFLRHPVDRAISHYYFIRQCDPRFCRHDRYEYAMSMDLLTFYRQPRFQNEMTMMLAGIPWHKLQRCIAHPVWRQWALRRACYNLKTQFACFGLQERFEESLQLFAHTFGWKISPENVQVKQTRSRPRLEEVPPAIYRKLAELNDLDMVLYRYACRLFDRHIQQLSCSLTYWS
ncbi:hypothetical protein Rhom172_1667 [Rhodothermus marinus SG0.5JP17-172]|uniref:sulfotransferase family 2 domain-containing protein n=1 Tax=Rhodothermus marinus TaxID=29549 RepID=UPI000223DAFA|nr:sulfotransferase family 2 domain-containing protein [Rhodothermus marinus]AEN73584.1 hypothetical protein Rhom172_1667 [Rhodothermus marinus SG0.5JP17-172]